MIDLAQAAEGTARVGFFEIFAIALAGLYGVVKSYGLAIILLTLAVRVLLLPLSIKQTRSMREMQLIQPEIKKLQAKHKGDRQKMNEEMMKLYKEHGVNPFGGCLPLAMQFPVLIALFYVIRTPLAYMGYVAERANGLTSWTPLQDPGIMERVQSSALARALDAAPLEINRFLGLRLDCSPSLVLSGETSDTVPEVACGSGLVSFLPYLVLILLMGYTTYYQQKQMQARQGDQAQQMPQMQTFMKIMPLLLMFFSFSFPTGVVIYWLTTNVWTIVQQRIILKAAPPIVPKKEETGRAAKETETKGAGGSASGGTDGQPDTGGGSPTPGRSRSRSSNARKRKKKKR